MKLTHHERLEAAILRQNKDNQPNQYSTLLASPAKGVPLLPAGESVYQGWYGKKYSITSDLEQAIVRGASPVGTVVVAIVVHLVGYFTGYYNAWSLLTRESKKLLNGDNICDFIFALFAHAGITILIGLILSAVQGNVGTLFEHSLLVSLWSNVVGGVWLLTRETISLVAMFNYLRNSEEDAN